MGAVVRERGAEVEAAVLLLFLVPAAATPEDEAGWAAVLLFFEVDAAAGAVKVEAAPILGEVDDEVESKTVEGRFSSEVVVVVVPTAAASLAGASFSRDFISVVVVVEPVPPPVVLSTRVVPSLAGAAASVGKLEPPAAAACGVVNSVPDALVRREAVEGL